jgi:hypothetical protein
MQEEDRADFKEKITKAVKETIAKSSPTNAVDVTRLIGELNLIIVQIIQEVWQETITTTHEIL